jgi:glyoxylase-like metal-dependent hydrolase (beta-lactamase superfamily II)
MGTASWCRVAITFAVLLQCAGVAAGAEDAGKGAKAAAPAWQKGDGDKGVALLKRIGKGLQVFRIPETHSDSGKTVDANCYAVADPVSRQVVVVDPGSTTGPRILAELEKAGFEPALVVITHYHVDHWGGTALLLSRTKAVSVISEKEAGFFTGERSIEINKKLFREHPAPRIDRKVKGGEELNLGKHIIQIIEISGHSPGSICLYFPAQDLVFTGDTLCPGTIGIPIGETVESFAGRIRSKLLGLPLATTVLPGHGDLTTIRIERASNPFVGDRAKG